ncbi:hypothetical protein [Variovorax sp. GB1P17]|uniref:hypothetical protein n=1 Tax=Variovorax sp. GB1P17 TaxID=3443740 RepID=UPI003F4749E1
MNATRSPAAQMLATLSGPTLARTKRPEIQRLADGGQVRHPAEPKAPRAPRIGAALILSTMPASHAKAKTMEQGGAILGPGTPTSDSVPIWASRDEFMLPADTAAAVGKENLQALVDATHTPTDKAREKMGRIARADGGLIDDQPGAVTRVGNSYSGGNVTGDISINGQAPGGTVSTIDSFRAPAPPAASPVPGAPAAVTPIAPRPAASPTSTLPSAAAAAPAPNSMQTGGQTSWIGRPQRPSGADQILAALGQAGQRIQPAPAPRAQAQLASTNRQIFASGVLGYADGGEIDDPRKPAPLPMFASPDAAAQALTGMAADARSNMAADVQMASLSPRAAAASATPQPYVAEIPRGRYESAAPFPAPAPVPAEQAQVRSIDNAIGAAPVTSPATAAAPAVQEAPASYQGAGSVGFVSGGVSAADRLSQLNRDIAFEKDKQTWRNPSDPTPGVTIIDNAASEADRRAQFNEQANLGNALARTSWSPRRGTQVNDAAVAAAMAPIDARARMAQLTVKEAGDTQRAQLAERGTDARARMADVRQQQELGINKQRLALDTQKVALDASRDDRQVTAALTEQARKGRVAQLDELILGGTPAQQKAAAAQKAALMGKGLDEAAKTGEVSTAIRKEFESLPEVKNYKQALPSYRGIEDAVKRNTPMSDINIVYGIAKLYDPNSVVREGEYATVANAPGMPERVKGWASYVAGGGKLTDEVKKQILTEAKSRMGTFDTEYGAARDRYAEIAKKSSADPSLVVPQDYKPAVVAPAAPVVPPQIAELQRRAVSDPAVAARLKQMGY